MITCCRGFFTNNVKVLNKIHIQYNYLGSLFPLIYQFSVRNVFKVDFFKVI